MRGKLLPSPARGQLLGQGVKARTGPGRPVDNGEPRSLPTGRTPVRRDGRALSRGGTGDRLCAVMREAQACLPGRPTGACGDRRPGRAGYPAMTSMGSAGWPARQARRQGHVTSSPGTTVGPVAVIVPTYNERDNIEIIASRVRAEVPEADLLVVDDNSPDGTGEIADKLASEDSHIHVLHRAGKAGLGAAYIAGFAWALEQGYGALVEMDADGSHRPEELPRLLAALAGADLVLGSRYVPGGAVLNWPRSRELLSRAGNTYARVMLGLELKDATGGYRVFRAATLRRIGLDSVDSQGYCFQIDLARRTILAGLTVTEVPITFVERERGTSKMSKAIVAEAFWRVAIWGVARLLPGRTRSR